MSDIEISQIVQEQIEVFYIRRIDKITKLKLKEAMARKNPYLYKVIGMESAEDIIKEILTAYMSSSDEGIFGDAFFEVLAEKVSGGNVSDAEGIDVTRIKEGLYYQAIAVKSGVNVFNNASRKKQIENFNSLEKRVNKRGYIFQPIIGYGYGKKTTSESNRIIELAGQEFWAELTNDSEFYLKIIDYIGETPKTHLTDYKKAFEDAIVRFTQEFHKDFCYEDGTIDWNKLVRFNSGKPCKKLEVSFKSNKALKLDEEYQIEVKAIFNEDTSIDLTGSEDVIYQLVDITNNTKISISPDGIVKLTDQAIKGEHLKVIISSYQKSLVRSFSLKC